MRRTQIYLPDNMTIELDKLAKEKGVSKSEIIRRAIEEFLEFKAINKRSEK